MPDVEIDLSNEAFFILAKIAHERDITFNQLVNDILREQMKKDYLSAEEAQSNGG